VNPSVTNDPSYWQSAASRFNGDENYFIQRMFTPEGAPEGASANLTLPTQVTPDLGSAPAFPAGTPTGNDVITSSPLTGPLDQAILDLINNKGKTGTALETATDQALMDRLGKIGSNQDLAMRLENVRAPFDSQRKAQLSQLDAQLADRGLISAPGATSGPDISSRGRVEQNLADSYSQGIRGALLDQNTSDIQAIQAATGQSQAEAASYLSAIGKGNDRQQMLANIAIQSLNQNIQWNQFLATYGLDRAKTMADIANGNTQTLIAFINANTNAASVAATGKSV
jgi:hypothetical protein